MDIVGLGTAIIECLRIREMIEMHGEKFLTHVYTAAEIHFCQARTHATEHFAARWAAKEAVLKSLGLNTARSVGWTEVETRTDPSGAATVVIAGRAGERMAAREVGDVRVAMAYCRSYATATAMALRGLQRTEE